MEFSNFTNTNTSTPAAPAPAAPAPAPQHDNSITSSLLGINNRVTPTPPPPAQQAQPQVTNRQQQTVQVPNSRAIPLQPGGAQHQQQNNDVLSIAERLKLGLPLEETAPHTPAQQQQQVQHQQQRPADPNAPDEQTEALTHFFRINPMNDLLTGVDRERLQEAISSGDLDGLLEVNRITAENAVRQAVRSFISLVPSIIEQARTAAQEDLSSHTERNATWSAFVARHPDFGPYRATIGNQLENALKNRSVPREHIFDAIATLNSGYLNTQQREQNSPRVDDGSQPFDLNSYLFGTQR